MDKAVRVLRLVVICFPVVALAGAGPIWVDLQTENITNSSAPGQTGQWWCKEHFGGNLGGTWECLEGTGSYCTSQVPNHTEVQCGRLKDDGTTPYNGAARVVAPFGYGRIERHLVSESADGRTGEWWCDNHFGKNLGGDWKCHNVSGLSSCSTRVPNHEVVSCSEDVVSEVSFAPACLPSGNHDERGRCCRTLSPDPEEQNFCILTEYVNVREKSTIYLYNDYLRAGLNRSFGGTLFELYGTDGQNRIQEHGGSAVQLSLWGNDAAGTNTGFFTKTTCDKTAYKTLKDCEAKYGANACKARHAPGAHISNCTTQKACPNWTAGGPWNPLQAQAENCLWNGPTNDVDHVTAKQQAGRPGPKHASDDITFFKAHPYQFTKTTAFPGMLWNVTGGVLSDRPYIKLTYRLAYNGPQETNAQVQEIPALFTDASIDHWYYFYGGDSPYGAANSPVTRLRSDFGTQLKLPSRSGTLPHPHPARYYDATEEWLTVCNRQEDQCLTVVAFAAKVKTIALVGPFGRRNYITPLGWFPLGPRRSSKWHIYLFPYRYDDVIVGKAVRQWIYDLKHGR